MKDVDDKFITDLLLEQLLSLDDGDMITYSEMSALAGVDVQFEYRNLLDRAFMVAREHHNAVFENKRNVGYERMSDEDVIKSLKEIDRIRRGTERERRNLCTVSFNDLDPVMKGKHNAKFLLVTVMANMAQGKTVKNIEARLGDIEVTINLQKALELVKDSVNDNDQT